MNLVDPGKAGFIQEQSIKKTYKSPVMIEHGTVETETNSGHTHAITPDGAGGSS